MTSTAPGQVRTQVAWPVAQDSAEGDLRGQVLKELREAEERKVHSGLRQKEEPEGRNGGPGRRALTRGSAGSGSSALACGL